MKRIFFVIPLLFLLCLGIQSQPAMKAPEAIRKADGDWLKAVQSKDLVKFWVSHTLWGVFLPWKPIHYVPLQELILASIWGLAFNSTGEMSRVPIICSGKSVARFDTLSPAYDVSPPCYPTRFYNNNHADDPVLRVSTGENETSVGNRQNIADPPISDPLSLRSLGRWTTRTCSTPVFIFYIHSPGRASTWVDALGP